MSEAGRGGGNNGQRVYRRSETVRLRRIAGEPLLIPISGRLADMQRIFVLNGIGEFVWSRIDGRRTAAEVAAEVAGAFEGAGEAVEDVPAFLAQLSEAGLVAEAE